MVSAVGAALVSSTGAAAGVASVTGVGATTSPSTTLPLPFALVIAGGADDAMLVALSPGEEEFTVTATADAPFTVEEV